MLKFSRLLSRLKAKIKGRIKMPKASASLKKLRLQAGLSQNNLARKSDLDRGTIASAEGGRDVSELTISKLSRALSIALNKEIDMADLLEN